MQAALTILASNNEAPVAEAECLLVIMAVITATEDQFQKYLAAAYQYIMKGIKKTDAINVSKCAISIMGDAAQALGQVRDREREREKNIYVSFFFFDILRFDMSSTSTVVVILSFFFFF